MVITNKICVCREQTSFENVRTFVDIEELIYIFVDIEFMKFITFETCDKTNSKIEKSLVSISSMCDKKR